VTFKMLVIAAALTLPASAAFAQTATPVGNGALSGRSPHQAYKTSDASATTCGKVMHTLPAGKLPTYGLNAFPAAPCDSPKLARADQKSDKARD
jgi:hypothetical protein